MYLFPCGEAHPPLVYFPGSEAEQGIYIQTAFFKGVKSFVTILYIKVLISKLIDNKLFIYLKFSKYTDANPISQDLFRISLERAYFATLRRRQ